MQAKWMVCSALVAGYWLTSAAVAATVAVAPHSTPIDQFHHWPDSELAAMIERNGKTFLSDHEFFFIQELNRSKSGEVEQHNLWNDYLVIQQGTAMLTYGGKAIGTTAQGMGESRGGKIEGGKMIALHPGDVVVIPAGMPHLFTLEAGKNLRYLVFKARQ